MWYAPLLLLLGSAWILASLLAVIIIISFVAIGSWYGAPFVWSSKDRINQMLALAALKSGDRVLDLGSGSGAIVIAAARCGAHAYGVEINPLLVWFARWRAKRAGLAKRVEILRGDFFHTPLPHDIDVVFVYLWPATLEQLVNKLVEELRPDARIISNGFLIPGLNLIQQQGAIRVYAPWYAQRER